MRAHPERAIAARAWIVVLALAASGWGGEAVVVAGEWPEVVMALLRDPEGLEVRSLYPGPARFLDAEPQALRAAAAAHAPVSGYAVLGVVRLEDAAEVEALLEVLREVTSPHLGERPCVWPRHSVRTWRDGAQLEAVLGFVCGVAEVEVSAPGKPRVRLRLSLGDDPRAAEALDRVLRARGVPTPDDPDAYAPLGPPTGADPDPGADTTPDRPPTGQGDRLDVTPQAR
jgi:hypothetical protein